MPAMRRQGCRAGVQSFRGESLDCFSDNLKLAYYRALPVGLGHELVMADLDVASAS
jgi:hypothetical protein